MLQSEEYNYLFLPEFVDIMDYEMQNLCTCNKEKENLFQQIIDFINDLKHYYLD